MGLADASHLRLARRVWLATCRRTDWRAFQNFSNVMDRMHGLWDTLALSNNPSLLNMQTTDTDLLFQTDKDLKDAARRSKKITATQSLGRPLSLSSKVLRVLVEGDTAWTAESGWQARSIDLKVSNVYITRYTRAYNQTGGTKRLFRGHTGPVTCVAIFPGPAGSLLFTGSWDKTIKVWDTTVSVPNAVL